MRIIVLSDTHIPERAKDLPKGLYQELAQASSIVHAGDFTRWWVVEKLQEFAPLWGVRGNMDEEEVGEKLPMKIVFVLGGVQIGLIHGGGSPLETRRMVAQAFAGEKVQLLVYGHTHQPSVERIGQVLWMNPGSPTDSFFAPFFSFGLVEIEEGTIRRAEIIRLN